jgi:type II secretory pathway pseudopilin PulG
MNRGLSAGFTLVEVMIVVLVSAPILLAVLSTIQEFARTVNVTGRNAEAAADAQVVADRVSRLVRAARRSTFLVRAEAADVANGTASTIGEWIPATDLVPRASIRFRSASGSLALHAADLTAPREIEFLRDAAESVDGADNDGDGLVDEGRIYLVYDGVRVPIADGVESCSFELDGSIVRFTVQFARIDASRGIHRSLSRHVWSVRNP